MSVSSIERELENILLNRPYHCDGIAALFSDDGGEDLDRMGVAGNMIIGKARGFRVRIGFTPTPIIRSPLRVGT